MNNEKFNDYKKYETTLVEEFEVVETAKTNSTVKNHKSKFKSIALTLSCSTLAFVGGLFVPSPNSQTAQLTNQNLSYTTETNSDKQETNVTIPSEENKETPQTENNEEKETANNEESKTNSSTENMSVEDVVKLVSPAVVTISGSNPYNFSSQSVGTGFIIKEDGTVVTNYHVIENCTQLTLTLQDGTEVNAEVIATSSEDDLAILKITDDIEMPGVAKLAESDEINAGQEIIAIGNPLGIEFSGSVSKGIISSTSRNVTIDGVTREFIQIDAAINPGNSGGPLINLKGEIIGVNTAKKSGENIEGMGFSVPIKYVQNILNNLDKYATSSNNTTGNYQANSNTGVQLGVKVLESYNGPIIQEITQNSLSDQMGLQVGDIIVGLNRQTVTSVQDLKALLSQLSTGDTLTLYLVRDGQLLQLSYTI